MLAEGDASTVFTGDAEREVAKHSVARFPNHVKLAKDQNAVHSNPELAPEMLALCDQILLSIQRDCNILMDAQADRSSKRRALEKISKETSVSTSTAKMTPAVASRLLTSISSPLVRSLDDGIEKVRELAVEIITKLVDASQTTTPPHVEHILPPVLHRLSFQQNANTQIEPSEEIRLALMRLLRRMMSSTLPPYVVPFIPSLSAVASAALRDSYAEIKKEGCQLIDFIWRRETAGFIKGHANKDVTEALFKCDVIGHRHSSVRVAGFKALKHVVLVDVTVYDEEVDRKLMKATTDTAPAVREALYDAAIQWALQLDDRYTYGYKFLPLILAGCSDEAPKLEELCWNGVDQLGALYEKDWEDRLKDELDYANHTVNDTTNSSIASLVRRHVRVGARHAFKDHSMKMVEKFASDGQGLKDWTSDMKAKTTQMLTVYLRIVEQHSTGYVNAFIPPLCRICADPKTEAFVAKEALRAAELIGYYIQPDVHLPHVITPLKNAPSSDFRLGHLRVLSALIRGARIINEDNMKHLVDAIANREFSLTETIPVMSAIADCLVELASKFPSSDIPPSDSMDFGLAEEITSESASSIDLDVVDKSTAGPLSSVEFEILLGCVIVATTPGDERLVGWRDLGSKSNDALLKLVQRRQLTGIPELYALHLPSSLDWLLAVQGQWTKHSPERRMLEPLVSNASSAVCDHLPVIVKLVSELCGKERDGEIRVSAFALLDKLVSNNALNRANEFATYVPELITNAILPSVIWRPGRDAAFIRGRGLRVLVNIILADGVTNADLDFMFEPSLAPAFVGCIDDDEVGSRRRCLVVLTKIFEKEVSMSDAAYKIIYPEVVRRLDDAQDAIRIEACHTLVAFYRHVASHWEEAGSQLDAEAWNGLVKSLTVHLDDTNVKVQDAVFETMKELAKLTAPVEDAITEIESVKSRHRTGQYLDAILDILRARL
ncbi:hypothetical protein SeLEV6574_g02641 [Synchytrium endobioticum]|uniref:Uncharacterized protein n=1 Tax=Synchytrium endobioticum TaxID=286115 RepID=A0A507D850_9FUNG|nr:hypothetical protein SeLEV6574_g02641 [Synchytrium endobioticum]